MSSQDELAGAGYAVSGDAGGPYAIRGPNVATMAADDAELAAFAAAVLAAAQANPTAAAALAAAAPPPPPLSAVTRRL